MVLVTLDVILDGVFHRVFGTRTFIFDRTGVAVLCFEDIDIFTIGCFTNAGKQILNSSVVNQVLCGNRAAFLFSFNFTNFEFYAVGEIIDTIEYKVFLRIRSQIQIPLQKSVGVHIFACRAVKLAGESRFNGSNRCCWLISVCEYRVLFAKELVLPFIRSDLHPGFGNSSVCHTVIRVINRAKIFMTFVAHDIAADSVSTGIGFGRQCLRRFIVTDEVH